MVIRLDACFYSGKWWGSGGMARATTTAEADPLRGRQTKGDRSPSGMTNKEGRIEDFIGASFLGVGWVR